MYLMCNVTWYTLAYGMTESGGMVTAHPRVSGSKLESEREGSVGTTAANFEIKVST